MRLTFSWLKSPVFWARFLGYAIPAGFFLYVLYLNYLPFGYHKTFTIDVGSPDDTQVSEFYLEPSADLSERKTAPDGTTYRELNGTASAVFKPKAVLKGAEVTVSVEGEGVEIIPPTIDFDPDTVKWDYDWDFTKEIPKELKNDGVFMFDGRAYFDGKSRLDLPDSANMFENGPFTFYVEWTPVDPDASSQQLVGHYNWWLSQGPNEILLRVGRMNGPEGPFYTIRHVITDKEHFFNSKHTVLFIYNPSHSGDIRFYLDNKLVGLQPLNDDKIFANYGKLNLYLGNRQESDNYLKGFVHRFSISERTILPKQSRLSFLLNHENDEPVILYSTVSRPIASVMLKVTAQ